MREWSERELELLARYYPEKGPSWEGWAKVLDNRSPRAVMCMAFNIGAKYRKPGSWSAEEDEVIRLHYPVKPKGWGGWRRLLPNRTRKQVCLRAWQLGVKSPKGEGWTDKDRKDLIQSVYGVSARTGHPFLGCVKELNNVVNREKRARQRAKEEE